MKFLWNSTKLKVDKSTCFQKNVNISSKSMVGGLGVSYSLSHTMDYATKMTKFVDEKSVSSTSRRRRAFVVRGRVGSIYGENSYAIVVVGINQKEYALHLCINKYYIDMYVE